MNSTAASPMWENHGQEFMKRRFTVTYLASRAVAEAEAELASAAEAESAATDAMAGTIQATLGALLRAMDSTGRGTREEAAADSEMQRLAKALTEEFTAPQRVKKLVKHRQAMARCAVHRERARAERVAHQAHEAELASIVRDELAAANKVLRSQKRKDTKNRRAAQREEAGRHLAYVAQAGAYVTQAGKAVAGVNSEGSENELGKRLQMMGIGGPEVQQGNYFHEAVLRALVEIKDKLAKKKADDATLLLMLLLLKGMSSRLDQGGCDERNETDKGKSAVDELDKGNSVMEDTTMVESDIKPAAGPSATNSRTIQEHTPSQVGSDIKPAAGPSAATNSRNIQAKTLQQMVKDFSDSIRTVPAIQDHTPSQVGSDKLFIQPADPCATDSVTRLGQYSVQDDLDHDEMAKKIAADQEMAYEAKNFSDYRRDWEAIWSETCGSFEHMTALSSMQFTSYAPRCSPSNVSSPETLQIFSIKLAKISHDLGWPLSVYGVVAVRDAVDHNRNFLFYCNSDNSQQLTQNDPFLRLIGPSRAVVYDDKVNFDIKLRVKGTTRSEDKALITEGRKFSQIFGNGASTVCFENCFCKIELSMQMVRRTTQATILGVQVVNSEQWPFKYGARVACSSLPGKIHVTEDNRVTYVTSPASGELVMVDSKDGAKLNGGDGYLQLSRNVVSVECQGRLDVGIQTYSKSGDIAAQCIVNFPPRFSKITRKHCSLNGVKVVITIAWSRVADDKRRVSSVGALVQSIGS